MDNWTELENEGSVYSEKGNKSDLILEMSPGE